MIEIRQIVAEPDRPTVTWVLRNIGFHRVFCFARTMPVRAFPSTRIRPSLGCEISYFTAENGVGTSCG